MPNPIVPEAAAAAPEVAPSPQDRWSSYSWFWAGWVAAAAVVETRAIWQDARIIDRVKRTLSSNTRTAFAWDSITGQPLDVPFGRLRRAAFIMLCAWFVEHIKRNGGTKEQRV
jgi:hypothetical protein